MIKIFLSALSIKTINIIVKTNNKNIPIIIKVEIAPVLPSSNVVTKALGISATIPEKIINEIPVIPNHTIQKCELINGNFVLISSEIFSNLGYLSSDYTHAMGDIDYGLRALKQNYSIVTTKKYIAFCSNHKNKPLLCDPKKNIIDRWKNLHSPKGLNLNEYKIFRMKFYPQDKFNFLIKVYLKFLFPNFYQFIKRDKI